MTQIYLSNAHSATSNKQNSTMKGVVLSVNKIQATSSSSISINNNNDFSNQAATNSWPGNGTITNPYIINQLTINGQDTSALAITNVNVYFTIANCTLSTVSSVSTISYQDLSLTNVSNGLIKDNLITDTTGYGAEISNVNNTQFINNTISNTGPGGFTIINSNNNLFTNNTFTNITNNISYNSYGFGMWYSSNNIVINNTFLHDDAGVAIYSDSSHNLISNNYIAYGHSYGIQTGNTKDNLYKNNTIISMGDSGILCGSGKNENDTFLHNYIFNSSVNGVYLLYSDHVNFINNTISNSTQNSGILFENSNYTLIKGNNIFNNSIGIYFSYSSYDNSIIENNITNNINLGLQIHNSGNPNKYNTIEWNDFIDNKNASQVADFSYPSTNYFKFNYYQGYNPANFKLLDKNNDGFGDNPYFIYDGNVTQLINRNFDPFPLVHPFENYLQLIQNQTYEQSAPHILTPTANQILQGMFEIQWLRSMDSLNSCMSYDVDISSNAGNTWITLATKTINNFFDWNTTNVANGTYLLKIVAYSETGNYVESAYTTISINNIIIQHTITETITTTSFITTSATSTSLNSSSVNTTTSPSFELISVLVLFPLLYIVRRKGTRKI